MKVISKFFDENDWSLYATLQTIIILICMRLGFPINNLKALVFASIIAFMSGDLFPRLIYTFFLSMVIWSNFKGLQFIKYTFFSLLGSFLTFFIKKNNKIYNFILNNKILKFLLIIGIAIWMFYIPYLLLKKIEIIF